MAGASFLMLGYENFTAQKSLLKQLYGEEIVTAATEEETHSSPK